MPVPSLYKWEGFIRKGIRRKICAKLNIHRGNLLGNKGAAESTPLSFCLFVFFLPPLSLISGLQEMLMTNISLV